MASDLAKRTLQVTRECLDLVSRGEFEQFVLLETERRSLMDQLLQSKSKDTEALQEVNEVSQALQSELEGIVLAPRQAAQPSGYEQGEGGSSYSAEA